MIDRISMNGIKLNKPCCPGSILEKGDYESCNNCRAYWVYDGHLFVLFDRSGSCRSCRHLYNERNRLYLISRKLDLLENEPAIVMKNKLEKGKKKKKN